MRPRTDGRPLPTEAVVDSDLCAACGICAGACPASTPFRSVADLVTGIDMAQRPVTALRADLERAIGSLRGATRIVVFGCDCAAGVRTLARVDTATVSLLCTGMLPPSFIEYALRSGVDGVFITGCRDEDCAYRLGNRWTDERVRARRKPHLRATVPRERLCIAWRGPFDIHALRADLERFRSSLSALPRVAALRPFKRKEMVDG